MDADQRSIAGRALIVFESMFGNTREIAGAIADGLSGEGVEVELREVTAAPGRVPSGFDLLVVGAPTHAFSLSRPKTRADAERQGASPGHAEFGMREWLSGLSWDGPKPTVAVFDTRVTKVRKLRWAANRAAVATLRRRGLRPGTEPVAFVVGDVKGPLEPGEVERATSWGRSLAPLAAAAGGTAVS